MQKPKRIIHNILDHNKLQKNEKSCIFFRVNLYCSQEYLTIGVLEG